MIIKIDHVGVAVKSLENIKQIMSLIFGLKPDFEEIVTDQQVKVVGFRVGESTIEFLEPTSHDSPISKFLEKRGEGLHHLALGVDNIKDTLSKIKANNIKLIDEEPRKGAEGKLIAFVHPKSLNGILLELSQESSEPID